METTQTVESYGNENAKFFEVINTMKGTVSKTEIVEKSYGIGCEEPSSMTKVPVYNLSQMSDTRWNELAKSMRR